MAFAYIQGDPLVDLVVQENGVPNFTSIISSNALPVSLAVTTV